jgi:hypothetical protein
LQRDGWLQREELPARRGSELTPGKGCYWDEHELEHPSFQLRHTFPAWEWAELDRGTLVWAESGCLYRAPVLPNELGAPRLLHDFNAMSFEPIAAPY